MNCPRCFSDRVQKRGFYRQRLQARYVQRFKCENCHKFFSTKTFAIDYYQKKPFINRPLFRSLCSGVSLRRSALNLDVSYSTVYRRFLWLMELAKIKHSEFIKSLKDVNVLFIDEMETIEHTKLKPVTIPMLVDENRRFLGVGVGRIPAKGRMARFSELKYGKRPDESTEKIRALFNLLPQDFKPHVVASDGKKAYSGLIQDRFPEVPHSVFIKKKTKVTEMPFLNQQKKKFDPLFSVNHRCAMIRSDLKRFVRRSWCTSKKLENLLGHLTIYACYNNKLVLV